MSTLERRGQRASKLRAAESRTRPAAPRRRARATGAGIASRPGETRGKILRAAERLFAERGFDAVSMRDITTAAAVNLASVNYHFGSKLALLAEVVASRAADLVVLRSKLLAAVARDRHGRPRLEAVITAFLRPSLEIAQQPGGADHMRLRARLAVERIGITRAEYERIFDASSQAFVDALCAALPGTPREEVYWGFHSMLGVMNYTMANSGRIQHMSDGVCDPGEVEPTLARLVPFVAGGFRALARK